MDKPSFFSVRHGLIQTEQTLNYDLYINSSSIKDREKFVKVFPQGEILGKDDLEKFESKYHQLYVSESQRKKFFKSLVKSTTVTDVDKVTVLKDSALDYLQSIFESKKEFSTELLSKNIEGCRDVVESMIDVLEGNDIDGLRNLITNLSFHDFYTYDHSINVCMYCISIYKVIHPEATRKELMHAGLGGLLHDLGKIKIPTHILNNPGGLSNEEYQEIKKHPDFGLELLLDGHCEIDQEIDLKIIGRIIHEHHENFDGTGYPNKLKGRDEIHVLARICTIADFFDAITTKRSYSEVLPLTEAMNTMRKFKGTKLDPDLFDIFDQHVGYVRHEIHRDLRLLDSFDPTLPYAKLPLEDLGKFKKELEFGKIKVVDSEKKTEKNKKGS
ncbi:MAG TPA: HD domain-containing phosphohydrolase [Bacteriovoracaceae bacterium]|nr:HD domain-containing phosphohydrolase [Bacteriovoracaceae bacterium]